MKQMSCFLTSVNLNVHDFLITFNSNRSDNFLKEDFSRYYHSLSILMISQSTIRRHHRITSTFESISDPLPNSKEPLPPNIETQLYSIFDAFDVNNSNMFEILNQLYLIFIQYGHSIHPYITSLQISNLINLLIPQLSSWHDITLQILWSCSFLSDDIFGYFMEADNFIPKMCGILEMNHINPNNNTILLTIQLLNYCISKNNNLTSKFVANMAFEKLRPFCNGPNQFMPLCTDIITNCLILYEFVQTAFPLMVQILETGDSHSIANILYVLSISNGESDPDDIINNYIFKNYLPRMTEFLNGDDTYLQEKVVLMFGSLIESDEEFFDYLHQNGIIEKVVNLLLQNDKELSFSVISFLETLLTFNSSGESTDVVLFSLAKFDFLGFCDQCCFAVRDKIIFFISKMALLSKPGQAASFITPRYLEILLLHFESSDLPEKRQICFNLHCILMQNQMIPEFCQMILSAWMQNDICANFCAELTSNELNTLLLE
ncbi:hypothetical protein TRFO_39085 [Tritrichomonas foetus]|uniref:Uncharacterized protein n=1 Tax=Tritrichomonas foetus TaxID=1144522 RepID=A0A1J4J8Z0_9EUKA|nr:hypothetical protein TRFO_39085 [Tritrichomonas foetus]|eukprot:OHS94711.1 hypothetical protein TRFO_39085 [Tritrichomonas foetus]